VGECCECAHTAVTHLTSGDALEPEKRNKARAMRRPCLFVIRQKSDDASSNRRHFQTGSSTLSPAHFGLPTTVLLVVTLPSVEPLTV
jgi:hypothetical protein